MKRQKKQFEKGWIDLSLKYREWQDLKIKGKVKMKKKINKDGKQYYDFDFTRYQYYYCYPQDHIGLAAPTIQRQFINHMLNKSCENFSNLYWDCEKTNWNQVQNILKPLQFHELLRDMGKQLTEKITSLRLEKTLRIKNMKGLFGPQNQFQKSMLQLIEAQIRSLMHKQIRLDNKYCLLGNGLQQRLNDHKSLLKTRTIDQFQFTDLTKGDISVLMRMRQVKHALMLNCQILKNVIQGYYKQNLAKLRGKVLQTRASKIFKQKFQAQIQRKQLQQSLVAKINQTDSTHFDNQQNKQKLYNLLNKLNYIQNFQYNVQQSISSKIYSQNFTTLQLNYDETLYIGLKKSQIKNRLISKMEYYFNKSLINQQILKSSDQHICYKVNNLCNLQLKVLWETYNFAYKKQESALIKIRSLMRKQLQLVFSKHINNLLNIRNHSIKVSTVQKWIPKLLHKPVPKTQKQAIFVNQISKANRFKDPTICSFIQLMGVNKEKVVRQQIQKYVQKVIQVSSNLYKHRSLYYQNCSCDQKMHLISVLNFNISLSHKKQDPTITRYYQLLHTLEPKQQIGSNILYSYYLLVFMRCSQARYQLMQIINAQIMCMIKIQSRIRLLWKKSKIPFEMTKQFVQRFVDPTDFAQHGFRFLNSEVCENHIEQLFKQMYNQDAERDYIQWNAQIGIQVRRSKSENLLLQGKSVLYTQTTQMLQQCLHRLQFFCSTTIKYRQSYLPDAKLTQIVDRFELLYEFLSLQNRFQKSKLQLLDQYCQQSQISISAQGIIKIYEDMNNIMNSQCCVDLTQPHFRQSYEGQIKEYQAKFNIFKLLIKKQKKHENQLIKTQINIYKISNFSNTMPQLSSMYYTEQITIQQNSIIQQAVEDQNQSVSDTQSQFMNPNAMGKNTISQVSSSMLDNASNYHLKMSFQQVLSKNTLQGIKDQNNKKDQIMNRKKQKIINDSILGALIPRYHKIQLDRNNQQFYNYLHFTVDVMRYLDTIVPNSDFYPQSHIKAVFLQQLVTLIQNYVFQQYKPLIKPQQVSVNSNYAHKTLNRFIQKFKLQGGISSRSSNQHWLCINSKIMQNIINGQTGEQIDQMRTLYICLNTFHLNQLNYKLEKIQKLQETSFSQSNILKQIITFYSNYKLDQKQFEIQKCNNFQKRQQTLLKLSSQLRQSGEMNYFCIGNYMQYYKANCLYTIATNNLMNSYNMYMRTFLQNISELQTQINIMQKYQCCTKLFQSLHNVPGIQNRVNLRKKLEIILTYKKTAIKKQYIDHFTQILHNCTKQIPKFRKIQSKMSLNSMASLSSEFEKYINEITKAGIMINMVSQQIKSAIHSQNQVSRVKQLCSLMPFIFKHVQIDELPNQSILHLFKEYNHTFDSQNKDNLKKCKLHISQQKVRIKYILESVLRAAESIVTWLRQQCNKRKKNELVGDKKKLQFIKYLSRHFANNFNQIQSNLQQKIIPSYLQQYKKYKNLVLLRQWLQTQLLLFGCNLNSNELIKYRKMLCNPLIIFPIFWQDNTKHIISNRQLAKLKSSSIDEQQIINNYKNQYLTYIHLKKSYKTFVEDLSEHDFQLQLHDTILTIYLGSPDFFKGQSQDWTFLTRYCDSFLNQPVTEVDQLCRYIKKSTKSLSYTKNRLYTLDHQKKQYNLTQIKYWLWGNPQKMQKVKTFDSNRRFIKQRLTQNKSLAIKPISDQVSLAYFQNQRLTQILSFLNVDISEYKLILQEFRHNFEKYVHQGYVQLKSNQIFVSNISEKDHQSKGQLIKSKQQLLKIIATNQFYIKLIREKFYQFCMNIIQNELKLRKILQQDLYNEQVSRDNKILKQTINKILVPKVKLNPFLASPLKVQNYFFAGTIKLSYIDQFLNKLRNRAVLIELAQGGTGYLLKVNELDQSVDALCKAIVGFSQKQFADRFRTVFESIEQTKQRNYKLAQQNNNLKSIINSIKGYQVKQIKSLLYEKLNDYLIQFYEHDKSYQIIINLLKSIENKIQNQLNLKYCQKIKLLENQNKQLKNKIKKIKDGQIQVIKQISTEARDNLYDSFKNKAEAILNKQFINQIDPNNKFQAIQALDTQTLLKKLKMQKAFYQIKLAKIQSNFTQKIRNLQKRLLQQSKLQNLLLMQQQKTKNLTRQLKQLQKCSIQNELLKKQMTKKEQQQTMQKFRLVKVNQSLKGKVKRIQDQLQHEKHTFSTKLQQLSKIQEKSKSSFSVQVSTDIHKSKRKTFHLKTQSNNNLNIFDVGVWKQKWLKSERKLQQLVQNLKKMYEHLLFTKNNSKALQNLKSIIGLYQIRRFESTFDQKIISKDK